MRASSASRATSRSGGCAPVCPCGSRQPPAMFALKVHSWSATVTEERRRAPPSAYPSELMAHPDLPAEQAYVDHAYAAVERIKRQLERLGQAVDAPEYQAAWFEEYARSRLATFEDVDRGLCFGKLDVDGASASLYIGRRWVHEGDAPLVVSWQAPAARPFYTATVAEPQGVTLRRRFRADGRRLVELYDEPLDGTAGDVVHGVADILLEELERSRDEHMRDIVATIQSDQFGLITREPHGVLVIQGGPGTGKTAVGLHRA